ncbi:MAG: radical SAM protein [Dehalococcoidales bacterium]|nr:radical SAM protein [Dehalococcoidales bacterium]
MLKTSVIYEPQGKAREYAKFAVNLYQGCGHWCTYCYAPASLRTTTERFHASLPRPDILERLSSDARKLSLQNTKDPVLMCFTCDPYQPIDEKYQLARKAIQTLHYYHLDIKILTKGGDRAERDFDLLTDRDYFGVTLTNLDDAMSLKWEPLAALPAERINSLIRAHEKSIKTWVSLEPVLYPEVTLEIIRKTYKFVDTFKVGKLNYHPHAKTIDWHTFAVNVKIILDELGCDYYLKEDLRACL